MEIKFISLLFERPLAIDLEPILAPWGPGWGMGLNCGPLTVRNSSVGCRRPRMYTKKIRYGDSALAGKKSSGDPLSLAGALAPSAPR